MVIYQCDRHQSYAAATRYWGVPLVEVGSFDIKVMMAPRKPKRVSFFEEFMEVSWKAYELLYVRKYNEAKLTQNNAIYMLFFLLPTW